MAHNEALPNNNNINLLKCKMASFCKIASMSRWSGDDGIYISCKYGNCLLMNNPLLKCGITNHDNVLEVYISNPEFDKFGSHIVDFLIHFLIHNLQTNFNSLVFVECGVMLEKLIVNGGMRPISQESMYTGMNKIGIFDYDEFARDLYANLNNEDKLHQFLEKQKELISLALQGENKLFLKNRGLISLGCNVEECWFSAFQIMYAINTHMKLGEAIGSDNVIVPSAEVREEVRRFDLEGISSMVSMNEQVDTPRYSSGEMEFEAMMRYLDSMSMNTGYNYKQTNIFRKSFNDD